MEGENWRGALHYGDKGRKAQAFVRKVLRTWRMSLDTFTFQHSSPTPNIDRSSFSLRKTWDCLV